MKRLILLGLALLFPTLADAGELQKVTFCRPNNMVSALAYVAEKQGYLREEGLDVEFQSATNAKICADGVIAGKTDFFTSVEVPPTYHGLTGTSLAIIAETGIMPEPALFVRRDKGINTEKDIKGKTIGYLPGTVSYTYFSRLLDKAGLVSGDVRTMALQPPAMPQALQSGLVDAIVIWSPWGDQAMTILGDKVVRLRDPSLYECAALIITSPAYAKAHPDQVKSLLKALLKAERYVHDHTQEAIPIIAEAVKLDPILLQKTWKDYRFRLKLDHSLPDLMTANAHYIIRDDENFKGKAIPDYKKSIDSSFLRAVAPERVEKGL